MSFAQAQVRAYVPAMRITYPIFEAFLKCPTKCHLRSLGETGSGNEYAEWVRSRDEAYEREGVRLLQQAVPEAERVFAPPATENLKAAKWRLAVGLLAQTPDSQGGHVRESQPSEEPRRPEAPRSEQLLEFRLHAVERVLSAVWTFSALLNSERTRSLGSGLREAIPSGLPPSHSAKDAVGTKVMLL